VLREFAAWWVEQVRSLIPGATALAGRQCDALIVALDGISPNLTGTLLLRQSGVETPLGPLDLDVKQPDAAADLPVALRLPPGTVLQRDVVLPLAAAQELQTVLGFEMDRLTPFAAEEVYWGVAGLHRDHAREKLNLRLLLVLRAQVDGFVQALARLKLTPAFIEVQGGRIELAKARPGTKQYMQWGLYALCGALACACLSVPFMRQQAALDAAASMISANAPAAHTAQALRQQLATAAQGRAAIAQARRAGDALQVLAALTDALPDGTWLSDLTLKSGDLTFDGQSSNAAQLIGLLSAVPGLRNPNFTAPVTRTTDGKADQFSLHAEVAE
jgi:general secretion pathway protein L